MKPFIRLTKSCWILAAALPLSACGAAFLNMAAHEIFLDEDVNLLARNQAAADYMITQADTFIKDYHLIKAMPLTDQMEPRVHAPIGKIIPEQIGTRLAQIGYAVNLEEVTTEPDTNYMKPGTLTGKTPDFILSGTYLRQSNKLEVSMRITERRTGRIVSSYDYALPMDSKIGEMSEAQPVIYRTTGN